MTKKNKIFETSLLKKHDYQKNIMRKHPAWKLRMTLMWILYSFSVAIILSFILLLIKHPTDNMGIFIFMCGAICFACIPFFIACSVKNTSKFKCGIPYTARMQEVLELTKDELIYRYFKINKHEQVFGLSTLSDSNCTFCFRIDIENIRSLSIDDNHICYIDGAGELSGPNLGRGSNRFSERCNKFNIMMSFKEDAEKELIRWWKNRGL